MGKISQQIEKLITSKRRRPSNATEKLHRGLLEELASDHSRLIYSPAFRRLSKKAQVFSLESNASVRSRITHSLEVADVGRLIASAVTKQLIEEERISLNLQVPIIFAVENACLVHDIGNPPFGHFGELAIQKWFETNWEYCYDKACPKSQTMKVRTNQLMKDFFQFDGNPQGLRILLRLKRDQDSFSYNLTYTTILSFIKYARSPLEPKGKGLKKKPGYFESERLIIENMKEELGLAKDARYLLAYIMEAADDIAYCISDIEDGIEKGLLTEKDFFETLNNEWPSSVPFPFANEKFQEEHFFDFKIAYTQAAIKKACEYFTREIDGLIQGINPSLFPEGCSEEKAFDALKNVARKKLYRSKMAENTELAGYQAVTGLLDKFRRLLEISEEDFNLLVENNPNHLKGKNLDLEWRLFNRLPDKHILAYKDQLKEFERQEFPEWYFRAHLIVDYISGMTDVFALEQYQLLSGIKIYQDDKQ